MASIDTIEGLGIKDGRKLRKAGLRTTDKLLKVCAERRGRRALARKLDIPEKKILRWVNRADIMRVKGIGREYADLLEHVGVDTVGELGRRNAANLHDAIVSANGSKRWVRRLPTTGMVETWVQQAAQMIPKVKH